MSKAGFAFANPTYTADNFFQYSAGDIEADRKLRATQIIEEIPAPRMSPPVMDLSEVLPPGRVAKMQAAGQIVFHSAGDTGGIIRPEPQLAVADAMAADRASRSGAGEQPAFLYHLGDVVYYFGQERYYPEQFYDPYRNYDAPIFAIPGNHDGVMYRNEQVDFSLQPFVENFCAATPSEAVPSFTRTTMTQPGVYFTLTAPFLRIIGLYSNTGESAGVLSDPKIGTAQIDFLKAQLAAAAAARREAQQALIVAVHHPPFTGSSQHFPSAGMLREIDECCEAAGIWPDLMLSGHAHLYERYTRTMKADGRAIPYVVAGNGGYYNLPGLKRNRFGRKPQPGVHTEPDGFGNTIRLDQYNDTDYGFLRITVSAGTIEVEAMAVTPSAQSNTPPTVQQMDAFTVDLRAHTVGAIQAPAQRGAKAAPGAKKAARKSAKKSPARRRK